MVCTYANFVAHHHFLFRGIPSSIRRLLAAGDESDVEVHPRRFGLCDQNPLLGLCIHLGALDHPAIQVQSGDEAWMETHAAYQYSQLHRACHHHLCLASLHRLILFREYFEWVLVSFEKTLTRVILNKSSVALAQEVLFQNLNEALQCLNEDPELNSG